MAEHKQPSEKRAIVKEYLKLCLDLKRSDAADAVAEKYGIHSKTVTTWAKRYQEPDVITHDFEIAVKPDIQQETVRVVPDGKRIFEIVASDIHFPYEDAEAYELFLDVATDLQPDILVLLGDILDMYAVSAHDKDPNRGTPDAFNEEIIYGRAKLEEIRDRLPNTRIIYFEGNHETRFSRYMRKNAAALSRMQGASLPELLNLKEQRIEWITNGSRLRIGKLWHIHGNEVSGAGMNPARLKYQRMQCNFIFGHHHQRDKFRPRAYDGQQHGAYGNPCLCQLEAEYLHHAHNWSHGFTLIDHDTDGTFQVDEIEVIKTNGRAKCNVRGRIYETQQAD